MLREKLVKIGAKVTRHSKYVTFQLAEVAVTRNLFAAILTTIAQLALPPPVVVGRMPAENAAAFGKRFGLRGQSARCRCEAPESTFWGMAPAAGTQKPGPWAKKWRRIPCVLVGAGGELLQS